MDLDSIRPDCDRELYNYISLLYGILVLMANDEINPTLFYKGKYHNLVCIRIVNALPEMRILCFNPVCHSIVVIDLLTINVQ